MVSSCASLFGAAGITSLETVLSSAIGDIDHSRQGMTKTKKVTNVVVLFFFCEQQFHFLCVCFNCFYLIICRFLFVN